jgi:hypothetical protein
MGNQDAGWTYSLPQSCFDEKSASGACITCTSSYKKHSKQTQLKMDIKKPAEAGFFMSDPRITSWLAFCCVSFWP